MDLGNSEQQWDSSPVAKVQVASRFPGSAARDVEYYPIKWLIRPMTTMVTEIYDRLSRDVRQTRSDVALLIGLVSVNIALSVAIVAKLFFV